MRETIQFSSLRNKKIDKYFSDEVYDFMLHNYFQNIPIEFLENFYLNDKKYKKISRKKFVVCSRPTSNNVSVRFTLGHLISKGAKLITFQHGGGYNLFKKKSLELLENGISDKLFKWGKDDEACNGFIVRKDILSYKKKNRNNHAIKYDVLVIGPSMYKYHVYNFGGHHPYYNNIITERIISLVNKLSENNISVYYRSYRAIPDPIVNRLGFEQDRKVALYELISMSKIVMCCNPYTQATEAVISGKPMILFWGDEYKFKPSVEKQMDILYKKNIIFSDPLKCAEYINRIKCRSDSWWTGLVQERGILTSLFGQYYDNWEERIYLALKKIR